MICQLLVSFNEIRKIAYAMIVFILTLNDIFSMLEVMNFSAITVTERTELGQRQSVEVESTSFKASKTTLNY
jgi:hypothetical protein